MSGLQARRATVDDLPALRGLWAAQHLPVADLEKRVTEFQLVETDAQDLVGAVGIQMQAYHGKIHSLAISSREHEAQARSLLWDRVEAVAKNNGLVRLWQPTSPILHKAPGFEPPTEEQLKKAPPGLGVDAAHWLTLKLREDTAAAALSLDKEFALFAETQRVSTEKIIEQGRKLRGFAYALALIVLAGALILFFIAYTKQPKATTSKKQNADTRAASATNQQNRSTNLTAP